MTKAQRIKELEKNIKRAHANYNRQRLREDLRLEVRVSSNLWWFAERDYREALHKLKASR
jgi:hypothetical protein